MRKEISEVANSGMERMHTAKKTSRRTREPVYDVAKGIGILTVVYGHLGILTAKSLIYAFHIPLFFFLSGIFHRRRHMGDLVRRKASTLMVPYLWAFMIFSVVDLAWLKLYPFNDFTLLSTRQSTGPLWFLRALFASCILYETLIWGAERIKLLRERKRYMFTVLAIVCLMCSVAGYIISLHKLRLPLYSGAVLTLIPFYGAGHMLMESGWLEKCMAKIKGMNMLWLTLAAIGGIGMLAGFDYLVAKILKIGMNDIVANKLIRNWWLFTAGCAIGIATVSVMSAALLKTGRPGRLFILLGSSSLYIMAIHKGVINIAVHYMGKPTTPGWIAIGVASVAASLLTKHIIKQSRQKGNRAQPSNDKKAQTGI